MTEATLERPDGHSLLDEEIEASLRRVDEAFAKSERRPAITETAPPPSNGVDDGDPFAELTRIMGFDPRAVSRRDEPRPRALPAGIPDRPSLDEEMSALLADLKKGSNRSPRPSPEDDLTTAEDLQRPREAAEDGPKDDFDLDEAFGTISQMPDAAEDDIDTTELDVAFGNDFGEPDDNDLHAAAIVLPATAAATMVATDLSADEGPQGAGAANPPPVELSTDNNGNGNALPPPHRDLPGGGNNNGGRIFTGLMAVLLLLLGAAGYWVWKDQGTLQVTNVDPQPAIVLDPSQPPETAHAVPNLGGIPLEEGDTNMTVDGTIPPPAEPAGTLTTAGINPAAATCLKANKDNCDDAKPAPAERVTVVFQPAKPEPKPEPKPAAQKAVVKAPAKKPAAATKAAVFPPRPQAVDEYGCPLKAGPAQTACLDRLVDLGVDIMWAEGIDVVPQFPSAPAIAAPATLAVGGPALSDFSKLKPCSACLKN